MNARVTAPLQVQLARGGSLFRRMRLSGRLDAIIEWNATGVREYVAVNGQKVVSQAAYLQSIPRFEFPLLAGGMSHMVIVDLSIKWVFLIKAFRIAIDNQSVYCEGDEMLLPTLALTRNPFTIETI